MLWHNAIVAGLSGLGRRAFGDLLASGRISPQLALTFETVGACQASSLSNTVLAGMSIIVRIPADWLLRLGCSATDT